MALTRVQANMDGAGSRFSVGSFASLTAAVAAIGATECTVVIDQSTSITGTTTIPTTMTMEKTRAGVITGAYSLVINGGMTGDMGSRWFNGPTVTGSPKIDYARPEWFAENTTPGETDMTTAIQDAADFASSVHLLGTTYLNSATITLTETFMEGLGAEQTKIIYSGTGYQIELVSSEQHGGLSKLYLASDGVGVGQIGLLVHGTMANVNNLYVAGHDTGGVRCGDGANSKGLYWSNLNRIRIAGRSGVTGTYGLLVDGTFPASNDNTFDQIVVSSTYTNPVKIGGRGNIWLGGGIECTTDLTDISYLLSLNGALETTVEGIYIEPTGGEVASGGFGLVDFGAGQGNKVTISANYTIVDAMVNVVNDVGVGNKLTIKRRATTTTIGTLQTGNQSNLIGNSALTLWRDANYPYGWYGIAGTAGNITRETTIIRGQLASLKMAEAASANSIRYYLNDYFGSTALNDFYSLDFLRGQNFVVGCWVKTTVAGAGNINASFITPTPSTYDQWTATPQQAHSGGGDWELLVGAGRFPPDITRAYVELRSEKALANITGDVYFSEPFLVLGSDLPTQLSRVLTDAGKQKMYGDLEFPIDYTDKELGGVIKLNGFYLWVDTTGDLRIGATRPTEATWDSAGAVVGTQS